MLLFVSMETSNLHYDIYKDIVHSNPENDTIVLIPKNLGGGEIIEEDYLATSVTLGTMKYLLKGDESVDSIFELTYKEPIITLEQYTSENDDLYDRLEALRILSPLISTTRQKTEQSIRLKKEEKEFLTRTQKVEVYCHELQEGINSETVQGRINKRKAEILKREERIKESSEAYERLKNLGSISLSEARRMKRPDDFTPGYRNSVVGQISLEFMRGIISDSKVGAFMGVAAVDVMISAGDAIDPGLYKRLDDIASVGLGSIGKEMAVGSRYMQGAVAPPHHTTGDRRLYPFTRPNPGE